ncbi:MAG: efflux RND transporter permease subunit, partial [Planctomycetes bacterium]|nr:efflux RND transporter permease subunit [Planctomycetota bacterium]
MIAEFAIRKRVAVMLMCIGITVMGVWSYLSLPRENFPDIRIPYVIVSTRLPGANPVDIESSVTVPMETELDDIEGLKDMRSVSSEEQSTVILEFDSELETEVTLNRVRDKVDIAKGKLPAEAEEPIVQEMSFTSVPVLIYNVIGSDHVALSELQEMAEKLQKRLEAIPGVLGVDLHGDRERKVPIELDMDRLRYYGISLPQALAILQGANANFSAGAVEVPGVRLMVRSPNEFRSPEEVFSLVVGVHDGVPIYMRDISRVS